MKKAKGNKSGSNVLALVQNLKDGTGVAVALVGFKPYDVKYGDLKGYPAIEIHLAHEEAKELLHALKTHYEGVKA